MHRSAFVRIAKVAPHLSLRRLDEITVDDATALVAVLAAHPYKRETIRKTRTALAQVLDHYAIDPNPLRDQRVKLPKERKAHIPPPLAEHVERVTETVAPEYVLPLLIIDECGPRVSELETVRGRRPRRAPPRDPGALDVREERAVPASRATRRPVRGAPRDAAAARGSRPRRAVVPRA